MTRVLVTLSGLAAAVVLAAGCGSSSGSSSSGGGNGFDAGSTAPAATNTTAATPASSSASSASGGLKLTADESNGLSFDKKTLTAKSGKVTITLDNPSADSLPHAIAVEGNGVTKSGQTVQPGGTSTVSADLKPGTYTFFCPVPGHRQAGMEGTLTVQ
jgi:uncharacterized cupredoxin-like copper-binding protein